MNLKSIEIPTSVTNIKNQAFYNINYMFVDEIIYKGTKQEWNAIEKELDWNRMGYRNVYDENGEYIDEEIVYLEQVICSDGVLEVN